MNRRQFLAGATTRARRDALADCWGISSASNAAAWCIIDRSQRLRPARVGSRSNRFARIVVSGLLPTFKNGRANPGASRIGAIGGRFHYGAGSGAGGGGIVTKHNAYSVRNCVCDLGDDYDYDRDDRFYAGCVSAEWRGPGTTRLAGLAEGKPDGPAFTGALVAFSH